LLGALGQLSEAESLEMEALALRFFELDPDWQGPPAVG